LRSYAWEGKAKISGNLLISENPGQFSGLEKYFYLKDLDVNAFIMAVFIPYLNKPFMVKKIYAQNQSDPDTVEIVSFWDEPVDLGSIGYTSIQFLSQYDIQMLPEALDLLFLLLRELCQTYSINLPKTFIQPGGLIPQLIPEKSVPVLAKYYVASALYPKPALKVFNEYDPYHDNKFRLRSGDFEERVQNLDTVKQIIADAVAKHRVLITTKHFVTYVLPGQLNWNDYLKRLDSLLAWCKSKGIQIKTYSEWAKILYETSQNPYVNVFPSLNVDLDENGLPDGYYIKQGYTDGIYDTTDGIRESGFSSYKINKVGSICFVKDLGGIEKGENDFLIYTKGEPGDSIEVVFTTSGGAFLGNLKFPADTYSWRRYKGTINVPYDVSLINVRIRCSNYSSGWVKVSGMTLRKKIDKFIKIVSLPDTLIYPCSQYEYKIDVYSFHYDDTLLYRISSNASWLTLSNNILRGIAPCDTGVFFVNLIVEDQHGNTDTQSFNIYIRKNINNILDNRYMPKEFLLYPNYPNPFNSSTNIKFAVKSKSLVEIKIFDILGKEIEKLVDKEFEPGIYTISWNANNLPSGLYLCRMKAGNFVSSIKLLLIK
jgi:hypothetical protein